MTRFTLSGIATAILLALIATPSRGALVSYYPLDGNFNDVVSGFNGTASGPISFVPGVKGQAADFAGNFVTLTTGANLGLGGNFTVSAFINSDNLSGDHAILGNDGGSSNNTLHLITRGNTPHLGFFANDTAGPGILATGTNTHIVWQFESGTQRMFVNGAQVASTGGHAAFAGTANNVLMGRWGGGNLMDGRIDDVSIFNNALSSTEIALLTLGQDPRNLSVNLLPLGGWNSTTHKRPGNANISDGGNGNGFGGSQSVIDALNNGPVIGSGVVNSVNYADLNNQGGGGNFPNSFNPFGLDGGIDDQHFVVKSTGFLQITTAGNYQFRNNTDDGSRLRLDLNGNGSFEPNETIILDDVLSGDHNADSAIIGLTPGQYMIEHVWYERDGGAEGDMGVAFNGGAFQLFGNPRADGFGAFFTSGIFVTQQAIVPEPASLSMLALGGLALLRRRRTA